MKRYQNFHYFKRAFTPPSPSFHISRISLLWLTDGAITDGAAQEFRRRPAVVVAAAASDKLC